MNIVKKLFSSEGLRHTIVSVCNVAVDVVVKSGDRDWVRLEPHPLSDAQKLKFEMGVYYPEKPRGHLRMLENKLDVLKACQAWLDVAWEINMGDKVDRLGGFMVFDKPEIESFGHFLLDHFKQCKGVAYKTIIDDCEASFSRREYFMANGDCFVPTKLRCKRLLWFDDELPYKPKGDVSDWMTFFDMQKSIQVGSQTKREMVKPETIQYLNSVAKEV